jgi:hypothetical protein
MTFSSVEHAFAGADDYVQRDRMLQVQALTRELEAKMWSVTFMLCDDPVDVVVRAGHEPGDTPDAMKDGAWIAAITMYRQHGDANAGQAILDAVNGVH